MTITETLAKNRGDLENKLRNLLAKPVFILELDAFALPCGCKGATINTRGLQIDDLEIFEEHINEYLKNTSENLEVEPSFLFARLVPGTAEVASLNSRVLCNRCYMDFACGTGKQPRPDIYILNFSRRE
ncbi:hypothetical protein MettiDRAFT_1011 [Methanolobus tindarius DSM 2278]|jgi:hypothetical protein|uniref:DUF5402 family protein n=1 Tax=Methanolobus tindarius DSM 2278 TaxID=1090322 RepID=W9DNG0_METTI|nr:DUF5402 family protein [Methanolobus tindarius]ETA67584.1 hypothetical protein MettiDRAFT_1011 [Methanolobus tindarius DSM 2278]